MSYILGKLMIFKSAFSGKVMLVPLTVIGQGLEWIFLQKNSDVVCTKFALDLVQ